MLNVFIVHFLPNKDRKEYLLKSDIFSKFRCVWNTSYQEIDDIPKDLGFSISRKEMCVSLAHEDILRTILKEDIKDFIILEDDALINEGSFTPEFFEKALCEFKNSDADLLYLAEAPIHWNLNVKNIETGKLVYTDVKQCSIATHAYTIRPDKIKTILDELDYHLPIDHEHNRLIGLLNLKVAWTSPGIKQGTHTNLYKSNLR